MIFFFYVLSYIIDLAPAVRHHERMSHPGFTEMGMVAGERHTNGNSGMIAGDSGYVNDDRAFANETNVYTNGYLNGGQSRNF